MSRRVVNSRLTSLLFSPIEQTVLDRYSKAKPSTHPIRDDIAAIAGKVEFLVIQMQTIEKTMRMLAKKGGVGERDLIKY